MWTQHRPNPFHHYTFVYCAFLFYFHQSVLSIQSRGRLLAGSCACVCAFFYFCWLVEISTDSIHLHQGQTFFLLEMTNSHCSHLFSRPLIFDSLYSLNIQNILSVFLSPQLSSYSKANSVFAAYTYLSPLYVWNTSHSCWRFLNYQFSLISNLTDSHGCTSLQVDCKKSTW